MADTESVIAQSHGQVFRAVVTHPDLEAPLPLDLTDASVSMDEGRAPRVTASLTAGLSAALADALAVVDPRTGARVEVQAGYVRPGGVADVQEWVDLGIRSRTIDHIEGTLSIECAGDEALLIDGSPAVAASVTSSTHSGAALAVIAQALSPAPILVATVTGGSVTVDPITNRWDTVQDLADRVDAKVYDDGSRTWHFDPSPTAAGSPVLSLTVGTGGTLLRAAPSLDRDSWANYVTLRYKWRDSADVDHQVLATAYISDGPYAITGPSGKRIFLHERDTQTTQAAANAAAASVLARMQTRSQVAHLSAVSAYWVAPGSTVRVRYTSTGEWVTYLVASVRFGLDGTMDLDVRVPDTTGTITTVATTTPPSLPPDPDPQPPAASKYVSTWTSNSVRTFKGDGSQNSFGDAGTGVDVNHGFYDSTNGNQRGILLFTASNSTGSETSSSVTSALSGATLSKVEVRLYVNHTYAGSGGILRIGYYNGTSLPSTFTSPAPYVTTGRTTAGTYLWVNITNAGLIAALKAGTCRAIAIGSGVGSDRTYYVIINGSAASSNKPLMRLTYSK